MNESRVKINGRKVLSLNEPHPASFDALRWIMEKSPAELCEWQETFASCAIENNRLAEICCETLRRLQAGESVSDRYLLGLVWTIRDFCGNEGYTDE